LVAAVGYRDRTVRRAALIALARELACCPDARAIITRREWRRICSSLGDADADSATTVLATIGDTGDRHLHGAVARVLREAKRGRAKPEIAAAAERCLGRLG
jgi:hypothetical protein